MVPWPGFAQTGPIALNVSGALADANGYPLAVSNVKFHLEVWDAASSCRLYAEDQIGVDLSASQGRFSLVLGAGSTKRNYISGTTALDANVFTNSGITTGFTGCPSGVSLASGDARNLRLFYDVGGGSVALTPDAPIVSTAFALVADSLQGRHAADFLQVNTGSASLSQGNAEYAFSATNWPRLKALVDGASTQYLSTTPTAAVSMNSQRVTNLTDPTQPQDAATKHYADTMLAGKPVDTSAITAMTGTGDVLQWDGTANKWVAAPVNTTPTGTAGGDLTGSYPNPTIKNDAITSAKISSATMGANRLLISDGGGGTTVSFGFCALNQVYAWTATGWACTDVASLSPVTKVAGKVGDVTLNAADIVGVKSAALYDVGTGATQIPQLDGSGRLPAVDGSQLTGVNATLLQTRPVANVAPVTGQVFGLERQRVGADQHLDGHVDRRRIGRGFVGRTDHLGRDVVGRRRHGREQDPAVERVGASAGGGRIVVDRR